MALRSSKITSEVLQTCNKLFSNDASMKITAALSTQKHKDREEQESSPFRYRIANTEKPILPEINLSEDQKSAPLFADLQPSAKSEFKFDFSPPKWAEKTSNDSPFPSVIPSKPRVVSIYTDQQKAEDKMLKYKLTYLNSQHRHYSTGFHFRPYSKGPADNNSLGNCKKPISKCVAKKSKAKVCKMNKDCPKLTLLNCKQSKGSNCKLNYLDPNCVKKFAPYPSYSESCVENLPDDPSECQQCPWRTCDGADTIEPGKPVRHKRSYSTSCSQHLDATAGIVMAPLREEINDYLVGGKGGKCGQVKHPCKQPKGPCEIRREKEELEKKKKDPHYKDPSKKKAEGMMLTGAALDYQQLVVDGQKLSIDVNPLDMGTKDSWIDIVGEELSLNPQSSDGQNKSKPPNCNRHKKPKRPDNDQPVDKDLGIEFGNAEWWTGRGKTSVVLERDSSVRPECSQNCPNMKIRNKRMLMKKGGKRIKGDEGHPPPCEEAHNPSKHCPKEPLTKPKYKKRPLTGSFYQNPEDPYNKSNGNGK